MFYLSAVVAVCALFYMRQKKKRNSKIKALGEPDMVRNMCGSVSGKKRFLKILLKLTAMMLLITAMARPKSGLKEETVQKRGIDIITVLDVSKSMLAKDTAPNRFERAKLELLSLIDKLESDRIGLVLFSGSAFMQMPLTLDYSAARLFVKSATVDSLPKPGSAGAHAIDICLNVFKRVVGRAKAIVIFTDGEFHDESLLEKVKSAKENDVAIYAIGFGTETGGPIPMREKSGVTDFKKDKKGNVVLSRMERKKLAEITRLTGGEYFTSADSEVIERIVSSFARLEKRGLKETIYTRFEEKFAIPLFLAGILLFIESLMNERKKKNSNC